MKKYLSTDQFKLYDLINGKIKMKNSKILGEPEGTPLKFN